VGGIAKGCELSGCALIGGETAEMPGMYPDGEYDLAGFAVGAVEKSKILTGQNVKPGDVVLGLASHGVHSNGFSLVRKCIERAEAQARARHAGRQALQGRHHGAHPSVREERAGRAGQHPIKALAHITGGGLLENIPRVLPEGTGAHLKAGSWPQTELFAWLQKTAGIDDIEMNRTFNNGIGMVVVVAAEHAEATAATLRGWARRSTDRPIASAAKALPLRFADRAASSRARHHGPESSQLPAFALPAPHAATRRSGQLSADGRRLAAGHVAGLLPGLLCVRGLSAHPCAGRGITRCSAAPRAPCPALGQVWRPPSSCWRRCCC
jgi:hypothetical protein